MRNVSIISLLMLVSCVSPREPCCTGMPPGATNQLAFLHSKDIPQITEVVRRKTSDGVVGQIWWTSPNEAIVCVTDGCWEVLRFADGRWGTGEHWPKLTPEQKKDWLEKQHDRLVVP